MTKETEAPTEARRFMDWRVAALMGGLLALLWVGPVQVHPPVGWVDPGLYIYWFRNPAENFALRGGDYHGARLGFVLPGAILYALFGMGTAQALLVSAFHLIGLLAVYAIAAAMLRGFVARAALVVFVALNPIWLAAMTRGYVDGPSIALALAALAVMLRCRDSGDAYRPVAAGALLSLSFFVHPFGGGLAGLALAGLVLARAESAWALFAVAARLTAGAVAAFVALGLAAMAIGMPFLFFNMGVPRAVQGLTTVGPTAFHLPISSWIGETQRLMLFPLTIMLVGAGLWLARGAPRAVWSLGIAALLPMVALLATLPLWSSFLLQFNFYASYIWLPLVPALALFARGVEARVAGRAPWLVIVIGAAAAFGLALLLPLEVRQDRAMAIAAWTIILLLVIAALALLALRRAILVLPALLLAGSLAGAMSRDTATVLRLPGGADLAAQHAGLAEMQAFLREEGWERGRYLIWMDRARFTAVRGVPPAHLYQLSFAGTRLELNALDSLAASLGWSVAAIGFDMPALEGILGLDGKLTHMSAFGTERLITICAEPQDCEAALDTLRANGLRVTPAARREITVQGMPRFTILLAKLQPAPDVAPDAAQLAIVLRHLEPDASGPRPEAVECTAAGHTYTCWVGFRLADGSAWARAMLFERVGPINRLVSAQEKVQATLGRMDTLPELDQFASILRRLDTNTPDLQLEAPECLAGGQMRTCRVRFRLQDGSIWMRVLLFENIGQSMALFSAAGEKSHAGAP